MFEIRVALQVRFQLELFDGKRLRKIPCGIVPLITAEAVKLLKYEQVFYCSFHFILVKVAAKRPAAPREKTYNFFGFQHQQ